MGFGAIQRLFKNGSVCVTGMRGTGKDMLMANVACRRPHHISNVEYGDGYIPLNFDSLNIQNDNHALVSGKITPYVYPYPSGVDIFISDVGIYFPSQFNDHLNKRYPTLPYFLALSRQLGPDVNVHINTQNLGRCWLMLREQSAVYLRCVWCKVFGKIVIQRVVVYDKYESCVNRADPFWYPSCPTFASSEERRLHSNNKRMALQRYRETHGSVKSMILIYRNKSTYDTHYFRTLLKGTSPE